MFGLLDVILLRGIDDAKQHFLRQVLRLRPALEPALEEIHQGTVEPRVQLIAQLLLGGLEVAVCHGRYRHDRTTRLSRDLWGRKYLPEAGGFEKKARLVIGSERP